MKNNNLTSLNNLEQVKQLLGSGNLKICVVGIGRIGLPTALSFAKSGLPTVGVDINADLVSRINSSDYPLKDEPGYDVIFNEVIKNKKFYATTKIEDAVPNSDVILLSLPTPLSLSLTYKTGAFFSLAIFSSVSITSGSFSAITTGTPLS